MAVRSFTFALGSHWADWDEGEGIKMKFREFAINEHFPPVVLRPVDAGIIRQRRHDIFFPGKAIPLTCGYHKYRSNAEQCSYMIILTPIGERFEVTEARLVHNHPLDLTAQEMEKAKKAEEYWLKETTPRIRQLARIKLEHLFKVHSNRITSVETVSEAEIASYLEQQQRIIKDLQALLGSAGALEVEQETSLQAKLIEGYGRNSCIDSDRPLLVSAQTASGRLASFSRRGGTSSSASKPKTTVSTGSSSSSDHSSSESEAESEREGSWEPSECGRGTSSSASKRKLPAKMVPQTSKKKRQAAPSPRRSSSVLNAPNPRRSSSSAIQSGREKEEPPVIVLDDTDEETDQADKKPVLPPTDDVDPFNAFLRTLHPSFDFSTRAHLFAHPNIEINTVEQLKSVASSPKQLQGLLDELGKEIALEDGRKEAGMPMVWRTVLGEVLENKVQNGW
ncbi:hypothetical protein JCM5296_002480 [Sporobolomyces johnsonii]